jgi:hypothetical protein
MNDRFVFAFVYLLFANAAAAQTGAYTVKQRDSTIATETFAIVGDTLLSEIRFVRNVTRVRSRLVSVSGKLRSLVFEPITDRGSQRVQVTFDDDSVRARTDLSGWEMRRAFRAPSDGVTIVFANLGTSLLGFTLQSIVRDPKVAVRKIGVWFAYQNQLQEWTLHVQDAGAASLVSTTGLVMNLRFQGGALVAFLVPSQGVAAELQAK